MVATVATDRKARQITLIEVRSVLFITDYFVVMSGTTTRHVKGIYEDLLKNLKDQGLRPLGVEGEREADWVLLDYGDVVIHVMLDEKREYYQLERLWKDVPVTSWDRSPDHDDAG